MADSSDSLSRICRKNRREKKEASTFERLKITVEEHGRRDMCVASRYATPASLT
jgi:hypothetical protein